MTIHQIVVEEKKKNDILKSSVFRVHYFSAIKALLLVSFLSFCGISISFAEETPIFNNDLEIAEEDIVVKKNFFYQTIKWESVTHALEYKVEIENTEDFNIKEAFVTENSNVRFSLPAGKYRYRIFVYDYLGRQASVTKWQKFEIQKAQRTEIKLPSFFTKKSLQKTKQNQHEEAQEDKTLFFVDQVTKKSTVKIVNVDTKKKYSCKVIQLPEEKKDDDIQISLKDNTQLVIKRPTLDKGTYYVLVENEDEVLFISDTFTITEKEKAIYQIKDINIMAGASFDALFYNKFLLEVLEKNNFNASVDFKISYFPIDIKNTQLGFELNSFATQFVKKDDLFNFLMPMCFAQFNLAGRYKLGNKVGLNFKTGAGIAFVGKKTTYNVEDIDRQDVSLKMYSFLCAQAGCSVSFIPYKHLIMELGSDFTNVFIPKMNTGVLNTYVCIGVRF